MRYWFDTEFIEDGKTIDLMSIGIVAEDGRTFYAESSECDLRRQHIKIPEGQVRRYESTSDCSGEGMCDVVWIDRLTGEEISRYDGADPANTNSYYGATSDDERFKRLGRDPNALIDAKDAKPMPKFPVYDDGRWDDGDWE